MSHTPDQLAAIGVEVSRARIAKGLSKEQAAIRAGVSSITWKRVEDGEVVRDANRSKVLAVVELDADEILGIQRPGRPAPPERAAIPDWDEQPISVLVDNLDAISRALRRWKNGTRPGPDPNADPL